MLMPDSSNNISKDAIKVNPWFRGFVVFFVVFIVPPLALRPVVSRFMVSLSLALPAFGIRR
jgi:hypothetical protein